MALSMQALAQRVRVVAADEAFSLGLLARVGELALATLYPDAFARLLADIQRNPQHQQVVLEDQAFAMNHRELGAAMLADWGCRMRWCSRCVFTSSPNSQATPRIRAARGWCSAWCWRVPSRSCVSRPKTSTCA
jgi:Predicted signal transduction protein